MLREEIVHGIRQCIAESLDIPPDSINEGDRIITDLGADSLDMLDLTFSIEQHFGIKISSRETEKRTIEKLGGLPIEVDGIYTPEALAEFRLTMPEVPPEELGDGLHRAQFPRLVRVATMVNLVARLLDEKSG